MSGQEAMLPESSRVPRRSWLREGGEKPGPGASGLLGRFSGSFSPSAFILPLTSWNHWTRSPGVGKIRRGILTGHCGGKDGYTVKLRAAVRSGDYL